MAAPPIQNFGRFERKVPLDQSVNIYALWSTITPGVQKPISGYIDQGNNAIQFFLSCRDICEIMPNFPNKWPVCVSRNMTYILQKLKSRFNWLFARNRSRTLQLFIRASIVVPLAYFWIFVPRAVFHFDDLETHRKGFSPKKMIHGSPVRQSKYLISQTSQTF